jgi:hypothetical protein
MYLVSSIPHSSALEIEPPPGRVVAQDPSPVMPRMSDLELFLLARPSVSMTMKFAWHWLLMGEM